MTEREISQLEKTEEISMDNVPDVSKSTKNTQSEQVVQNDTVSEKETAQTIEENNNKTDLNKEENSEQHVAKKVKKPLVIMPKRKKSDVTDDAKQNKKIAWLAYILFFIPLLINKKSNFVRLHANEGLELNLVDVLGIVLLVCGAAIKTSSLVWHAILILSTIVGVSLLILTTISKIYMIIATLKGFSHQTPWFCKYRFIKDVKIDEE